MEDRKVHGFTGEVSMPSGSRALRYIFNVFSATLMLMIG